MLTPILLVFLTVGPAAPKTIAVLGLESGPATAELAQSLTLLIPTEVRRRSSARVTSADEIAALLGLERQKQLLGCNEGSSCFAELSGAIGADEVVVGRVGKAGSTYLLELKRVDTKRGATVGSTTRTASSEDALVDGVKDAIAELFAAPSEPGDPVRTAAFIGGGTLTALGLAGTVYGVATRGRVQAQQSPGAPLEVTRAQAQTAQLLYSVGLPAAAAGLAAIAFGALKPKSPALDATVGVTPLVGGASFAVSGAF